jgi:hypothetical protein
VRSEHPGGSVAAGANEVVVTGRSRRNSGNDNRQWDPWLAALDGGGALLASVFTFGVKLLLPGSRSPDSGPVGQPTPITCAGRVG